MSTTAAYSKEEVERAKVIFRELLACLTPRINAPRWDPGPMEVAVAALAMWVMRISWDTDPPQDAQAVVDHADWFAQIMRMAGAATLANQDDPIAVCEAAGRWSFAYSDPAGVDLKAEMEEALFRGLMAADKAEP
jgi:hypothetical protein